MQDPYQPHGGPPPRKSQGGSILKWLLLGVGIMIVLPCVGILGWIMYAAGFGPETSVYTGNEVPARFVKVMKEVGALEDDEEIIYFYSDAMTDIRDGFYFVSDKGVVYYSEVTGAEPLIRVDFEDIDEIEFFRNESFFEDSEITLVLKDGKLVSFPVSSEGDKDIRFREPIEERSTEAEGL